MSVSCCLEFFRPLTPLQTSPTLSSSSSLSILGNPLYHPPLTHAYIHRRRCASRERAAAEEEDIRADPVYQVSTKALSAYLVPYNPRTLTRELQTPPLLQFPAIFASPTTPSSSLIYILAPHRLSLPACHAIGTVPRPKPSSSIL